MYLEGQLDLEADGDVAYSVGFELIACGFALPTVTRGRPFSARYASLSLYNQELPNATIEGPPSVSVALAPGSAAYTTEMGGAAELLVTLVRRPQPGSVVVLAAATSRPEEAEVCGRRHRASSGERRRRARRVTSNPATYRRPPFVPSFVVE